MKTTRQKVTELLKEGKTRPQIARLLGLTSQAISYHQRQIKLRSSQPDSISDEAPKPVFIRQWKQYNEALVKRGEAILDLDVLQEEKQEIQRLNNNKVGRPFTYSNSLMQLLFVLKTAFSLDYRTLEGVSRRLIIALLDEHPVPDYTTIEVRFNKSHQQLSIYYQQLCEGDESAVDSTGRSVGERSSYRQSRYGVKFRKCVKLSVNVSIKTGQVIGLKVSDANDSDGQFLPELIEQGQRVMPLKVSYADRGYDSIKNYQYLMKQLIKPVIRPKSHKEQTRLWRDYCKILKQIEAGVSPAEREILLAKKVRYEAVIDCKNDLEGWKRLNNYGRRAQVEGFFSRDTRIMGDSVYSRKDSNIEKELTLRCSILNLFMHLIVSSGGKARMITRDESIKNKMEGGKELAVTYIEGCKYN